MRETRGWSQGQLAAQVGMPQTAISRLESTSYGKSTISTLKRLARVFDVALEVRFVPFSKFLDRITGTPYIEYGLSSDALDVPNFEEEDVRGIFVQAASHGDYQPGKPERTGPAQATGIPNLSQGQSPWLEKLGGTVQGKKQPSSEPNIYLVQGELANAASVGAPG